MRTGWGRKPSRDQAQPDWQRTAHGLTYAVNCPPLCQDCYARRHRHGETISRLVSRPNAKLRCLDCGVVYQDDTRTGRLARRKVA